jgi:hypothetical protein
LAHRFFFGIVIRRVERLNGVAVGAGAADGVAELLGADFAGIALVAFLALRASRGAKDFLVARGRRAVAGWRAL